MIYDLLMTVSAVFALLLLIHFRDRILAALRRFDQRNVARQQQEMLDRRDASAHIRRTLEVAEEQFEEVQELDAIDARTGRAAKRYVFEGEIFLTRDEAEYVRARKIGDRARDFYRELPAALAARGDNKLN